MARPRRIVTLEERRALLLRKSELSTLSQLAAWDVFLAVIEEKVEEIKRTVHMEAMSDTGISLEKQAYYRGRIRAMRSVALIPAKANTQMENEEMEREEASGE